MFMTVAICSFPINSRKGEEIGDLSLDNNVTTKTKD